jgi:hypothetical protein
MPAPVEIPIGAVPFQPDVPSAIPTTTTKSPTGGIVGGIVGAGVVGLLLVCLIYYRKTFLDITNGPKSNRENEQPSINPNTSVIEDQHTALSPSVPHDSISNTIQLPAEPLNAVSTASVAILACATQPEPHYVVDYKDQARSVEGRLQHATSKDRMAVDADLPVVSALAISTGTIASKANSTAEA